jgi:hypothetical protein
MGLYAAAGRFAVTAATANHFGFNLWNPSSTAQLSVLEISYCRSDAPVTVNVVQLVRSTVRGTAGSTVTPDVDNALDDDIAPPSGAVLDLAVFSVQPTIATPAQRRYGDFDAQGVGFSWTFDWPGITVPPGTGLGVANIAAITFKAGDVSVLWWEP